MSALEESIVEWLKGERLPIRRDLLIQEITRLAKHGNLWPLAPASEWHRAIDTAIGNDAIVELDGGLRLATEPVKNAEKQLELF